jgi:aryl-alcohol dehydrogenase-like predicted oxidoreductase
MDHRKLGRNGPEISVIGYGAWEAGGDVWGANESDQVVIDAIHAAIDSGMTWIDTAEVYGRGRSEELVGRAVEGRRDEVLLFSKLAPKPSGTGFGRDEVRGGIEGSLSRLRTDHLDLYQLHWPDRSVPIQETWSAMAELQDEGLTRHIGLSNVNKWYVEQCLPLRHVDSVQNELSLLYRDDRRTLLPWLAEQGVGYLAYGPLAYGMLSGAITKDTKFEPDDWRSGNRGFDSYQRFFAPGKLERNVERVERLRAIAERLGTPVAALALRWIVEQPGVTVAIAGSRNPQHVRANAAAGDLRLDPEALPEIEAAVA